MFVDNGVLRKGEAAAVVHTFRDAFKLNLIHVDASRRFLNVLRGVTDPELKRKRIGAEFIAVFEEEAARLGDIPWLAQDRKSTRLNSSHGYISYAVFCLK